MDVRLISVIVIILVVLMLTIKSLNARTHASPVDYVELSSSSGVSQAHKDRIVKLIESMSKNSEKQQIIYMLIAMGMDNQATKESYKTVIEHMNRIDQATRGRLHEPREIQTKLRDVFFPKIHDGQVINNPIDASNDAWYHLLYLSELREQRETFPAGYKAAMDYTKRTFSNFPQKIHVSQPRADLKNLLNGKGTLDDIRTFAKWIADHTDRIRTSEDLESRNILRRLAKLDVYEEGKEPDSNPMIQITCKFAQERAYRYEWTEVGEKSQVKSNLDGSNIDIGPHYVKIFRNYPYLEFMITAQLDIESSGQFKFKTSHVRVRRFILSNDLIVSNTIDVDKINDSGKTIDLQCSGKTIDLRKGPDSINHIRTRESVSFHECMALDHSTTWARANVLLACRGEKPSLTAGRNTGRENMSHDKNIYANVRFASDNCDVVMHSIDRSGNLATYGAYMDLWANQYENAQPRFNLKLNSNNDDDTSMYNEKAEKRGSHIENILDTMRHIAQGYTTTDNAGDSHKIGSTYNMELDEDKKLEGGHVYMDPTILTNYCMHVSGSEKTKDLILECPGKMIVS